MQFNFKFNLSNIYSNVKTFITTANLFIIAKYDLNFTNTSYLVILKLNENTCANLVLTFYSTSPINSGNSLNLFAN